ncbi:hypothetical protein BDR03DRAFT_984756 [Suillus americanus]|nr:hypothetical protein BDR03DRAFT_984756 [Suillus americanus]
MRGGPSLVLEVIAGTNPSVSSDRTPISCCLRVSTSNGRWNTTIKAVEADCDSVSWNETLNIYAPPLKLSQRLMSNSSARPKQSASKFVPYPTTQNLDLSLDGQFNALSGQKRCHPRRNRLRKSLFINTIAQKQLAKTSNDARGCTSTPERYPIVISGEKYVLIDTPGLNEVPEGTVPDAKAKKLLKSLLRELTSSRLDGIGLLVYCVRSAARPHTFVKAYNKFYSGICHKRVPIILVVKGWENEQGMES